MIGTFGMNDYHYHHLLGSPSYRNNFFGEASFIESVFSSEQAEYGSR